MKTALRERLSLLLQEIERGLVQRRGWQLADNIFWVREWRAMA